MNLRYSTFCILLLLSIQFSLIAQIPEGYYKTAIGKKEAELKTTIFNIISKHSILEYYSSSTSFLSTDWNPNGYFWDMYSNNKKTYWSGLNREHNLPKSWWSTSPETTIAYSDLHNLYPSDATANTAKSNYPLGIVSGIPTFSNGVVKVGSNSYPGYSGTVFEPANEYKGDFARDYMYMVTCYEDYSGNWRSLGTSSMLNGNTYPVFKTYAINLLMEWHRNDPVSEKEINRNNAVYNLQKNRNPFIDFPVLAEYLWGKYIGEFWSGTSDNPVDENFYLQFLPSEKALFVSLTKPETANYILYSSAGIVIQKGIVGVDTKIELTSLQKGLYVIVVYSEYQRLTSKFIIW